MLLVLYPSLSMLINYIENKKIILYTFLLGYIYCLLRTLKYIILHADVYVVAKESLGIHIMNVILMEFTFHDFLNV